MLQVAESIWGKIQCKRMKKKSNSIVHVLWVFTVCNILWIFFRADSVSDALYIMKRIFCDWGNTFQGGRSIKLLGNDLMVIYVNICVLMLYDFFSLKKDVIVWVSKRGVVVRWCLYMMLIWLIILGMPVSNSEFIYFQF